MRFLLSLTLLARRDVSIVDAEGLEPPTSAV